MADHDRSDRDRSEHQLQVHPQKGGGRQGPSTRQELAVITLLPVSGTLLALAGLTLAGSLIGLALATPLFLLFSPVLVPAAILLGLAVSGFLSSGAMGLTGLSALARVVGYVQGVMGSSVPEQMEYSKRRMQDALGYDGQKIKEVGQTIQSLQKIKEVGQTIQSKAQQEGGGRT
ncbi:Oleosin 5-like protein [Drosera capensis]